MYFPYFAGVMIAIKNNTKYIAVWQKYDESGKPTNSISQRQRGIKANLCSDNSKSMVIIPHSRKILGSASDMTNSIRNDTPRVMRFCAKFFDAYMAVYNEIDNS